MTHGRKLLHGGRRRSAQAVETRALLPHHSATVTTIVGSTTVMLPLFGDVLDDAVLCQVVVVDLVDGVVLALLLLFTGAPRAPQLALSGLYR